MIRVWRLGYEHWPCWAIRGIGWRHLWWRFFWFSPKLELEALDAYARVVGIRRRPDETNAQLRTRLVDVWRTPIR